MNKDTKFKIKLISFCLILVTVTVLIAYPNCVKGVSDFVKGIRTSDFNTNVVYKVSKLGKLQENITSNKEKLQEACKNNDTDLCKKSLESILAKIDSSKSDVRDELKQANKVAEKADSKSAKSNLTKVKKQYEKLLTEKTKITEAINVNNVESYNKLLSNTSIFGKEVDNYSSLGDELPRSNNSEEVEIKDEESSTAALASKEYPIDDKDITKNDEDKNLDETAETKFSDEVKAKAKEIGNNPIKLYEYVRNNINFEQYAGSRKGATGALEQLSGNDYDQSSLLIALLRCSNIPARYVTGTVNVSADEAIAWTGAADAKQAAKVLASMGNKTVALTSGGNIVSIQIEHVWVEAYCSINEYRGNGEDTGEKEWIPFDPSFKEYEKVQGDYDDIKQSVESELEINDLSVIGTETEDKLGKTFKYNKGLSDDLDDVKSCISDYINDDNYNGKTLLDITGGFKIKEEHLDCLPLSIPNSLVSIQDRNSKIEIAR